MAFLPHTTLSESPLGRMLIAPLELHNQRQFDKRDAELRKIAKIARSLRIIERHDPDLLQTFKRRFHRGVNRDEIVGDLFELHVASALINKKVCFEKSDPPDYVVHGTSKDVNIECGSVFVQLDAEGDLGYKIDSAVSSKSGKPYSHRGTALFLDITAVDAKSMLSGYPIHTEELRPHMAELLKRSGFGTLLLFTGMWIRDSDRFELFYVRADSDEIYPELRYFLDRCYPKGKRGVLISVT